MVWTDNMLIPKGATNKYTAELMMNWVYDPTIAAQIANYVYYVSPVKGAEAIVKQLNASSPTRPRSCPSSSRRRTSSPSSTTSSSSARPREVPELPVHSTCPALIPRSGRAPHAMTAVAPAAGRRPPIHWRRGSARRPLPAARAGPDLAARLLHLPVHPDVPTSRSRAGRWTRASLTFSTDAYVTAPPEVPPPVRELDPLRRPGDDLLTFLIGFPVAYTDGVQGRALQEPPAVPGDRPVLHELPDPDDQLEGPARRRGPAARIPQARLHVLPDGFSILGTPVAVVAGLTYNFLPFMILPLYVALEKIDPRLIEAAQDLYATNWGAFRRVTLPLALPGVFAGTC
jgi:ABC-type proline/glycine betaine transport system permease subunit